LTQINAAFGTIGCAFDISGIFREDAMSHPLVPSDRVEAAVVYGRDGQKLGTIERLMLEKKSGTVAYAVVKCGGVFQGHIHHYPVPWSSLKYNVTREGYETVLSLEQLRSGPSELDGGALDWGDRSPIYPQYWIL
jgi:sporulation protein YlmC with PRC-barrel domain